MDVVWPLLAGYVIASLAVIGWKISKVSVIVVEELRASLNVKHEDLQIRVNDAAIGLDELHEEVRSLRSLAGAYDVTTTCPGIFFAWFNVNRGWTGPVAMSHQGPKARLSCSWDDVKRLVQSARNIVASEYEVEAPVRRSAKRFLSAWDADNLQSGPGEGYDEGDASSE